MVKGSVQAELSQSSDSHQRLLKWISLLWSGMFFITPYYEHSWRVWAGFAAVYAVFLLIYFGIAEASRPLMARVLLGLMFALGYVWFPFNHSSAGVFVYAAGLLGYVYKEPRAKLAATVFAGIVGLEIAAVAVEVHMMHLSMEWVENIAFYIVVIGLSNFAYSRQMMASAQLKRANQEIERLAQTAERERIARDLHDLLGHTLTVIAIKADLANRVFELDPERARQEISEVEATARKALAEVREAVAGYRATGLAAEIAQARRALAAAGVQLTTNLEPVRVPDELLTTLCLVLREAVTNVVRHARATICRLEMLQTEAGLRLVVEDDGVGELRAEGNGLRGMRERVGAEGGRMEVRSGRRTGTRLEVELPFEGENGREMSVAEAAPVGVEEGRKASEGRLGGLIEA